MKGKLDKNQGNISVAISIRLRYKYLVHISVSFEYAFILNSRKVLFTQTLINTEIVLSYLV